MKLVKQTLLNANCWCFLLGLAFIWNPQAIQAETSVDNMEESMDNNKHVTIRNNGSCAVNIYWWKADGDVFYTTIQPGGSWAVWASQGHKWRAVDTDNVWNSLKYDQMYTTTSSSSQTWNITPNYCGGGGCTGKITSLKINKQNGSALVNLTNGASFCESDFPNDIRIRSTESGSHESLKYTISGPGGTWTNIENHVTYDSKQFWPTPGTWTIKAELFKGHDGTGTKCDTETISFNITGPSTATNGGAFSPRATVKCDVDNFNQGAIQPSNGKCSDNSTPRYYWQVKPEAGGSWTNISGATGASYNPPSQGIGSKWYRRGTSCGCSTSAKYTDTVYDVHVYNPKAGSIAGNQSKCDGYNPSNITSSSAASDGKGNLTYRWQSRVDGGSWTVINGATGATYTPGHISVTTQYRRQAQYDSQCTARKTSNVVTKTVEDCGPNFDCPALNANIGDACNDGNANTTNDMVNGNCNCVGTPIGPVYDCPALNANIGDSCNDGNPNTNNDVVGSNCQCAGTPVGGGTCNATYSVNGRVITVSNLTGAIKAVKIIDNQWNTLYSCDDWGTNPCGGTESYTVPSCGTYSVQIQTYADWSTPICNLFETFTIDTDCGGGVDCPGLGNIGDTCNDGNPNTNNDVVQANCTCAGTPTVPVYDCPALGANIGDSCNDGNANTSNDVVQANCTCAGTPGSTTCDATYRVEGNKIIIEGLDAAINTAKILTSNWATEAECSDWTTPCNGMLMATVADGSYFVQIQTYADWSTPLCDIFEEVTVGGGGTTYDCPALGANIGDTCNDGNPNTNNDVVQANCSCAGTPTGPVYDCPALSANIGDSCNDGNANTTNDTVQADCSCVGTPTGPTTCDATYSVDGNKIIINGLDAPIVSAKILTSAWVTVAECSDWTTACNGMLMATVQPGDYFVQIQTYTDWSNQVCDIFESVTVTGGGGGCDNVTDGGTIAGNETGCGTYDPGMITSAAAPSGGSGALEYLWLSSTTSCPRYLTQAIDGASGATYNPGPISQTTYYVRCSRRAGCTVWTAGESNCVTKTVDNNCNTECADRTATNAKSNCGQGENYGFYAVDLVNGINDGNLYSISNGSFVEYTDGTARFTARATNNDDVWVKWDIDISFSGRTSIAPAGSPKTGDFCPYPAGSDYYYYTSTNGTLTGIDAVAGAKVSVTRKGEAFQVGTGANIHEQNRFGASGWLNYTVTDQPNNNAYTLNNGVGMDINIRLSGSPTACNNGPTFDCPALGANIGDTCNDGDANTENDVVQADCSCAGTPVGGGCNITISTGASSITVTGAVGPYPNVGIFDDFGNTIYECHAFNGGCPTTVQVNNLAPGVYWVNARVVDTDWVTVLCEAAEDPTIGGARMSNGNQIFVPEGQNVLETKESVDFTLFPNPASENVNVSLEGYTGKDVTIQMIDYTGRPVKSISIDNVNDTKIVIPIERISNGIYTVRILSDGIKPIGKKMIVNKQF